MGGKEQSPSLFGGAGRQLKSGAEIVEAARPEESPLKDILGRGVKKRLGRSAVGRAILLTLYS